MFVIWHKNRKAHVRDDWLEKTKLFPTHKLATSYATLSFGPFGKKQGAIGVSGYSDWKVEDAEDHDKRHSGSAGWRSPVSLLPED